MADYVSNYSGDQIDEAVGRALPGGSLERLVADKVPVLSRAVGIASDEDLIARIENAAASILANTAHGGAAILPIHFSAVHSVLGASNNTLLIRCVNHAVIEVVANVEAGGFTTRVQRIKTANGWGAFEYVNPPMLLGVEYRTTERYLGKPVYAKKLEVACPAANSSVKVAIGAENIKFAFLDRSLCMYYRGTNGENKLDNPEFCKALYINGGEVCFSGGAEASGTGYLHYVVKYTKSTD